MISWSATSSVIAVPSNTSRRRRDDKLRLHIGGRLRGDRRYSHPSRGSPASERSRGRTCRPRSSGSSCPDRRRPADRVEGGANPAERVVSLTISEAGGVSDARASRVGTREIANPRRDRIRRRDARRIRRDRGPVDHDVVGLVVRSGERRRGARHVHIRNVAGAGIACDRCCCPRRPGLNRDDVTWRPSGRRGRTAGRGRCGSPSRFRRSAPS